MKKSPFVLLSAWNLFFGSVPAFLSLVITGLASAKEPLAKCDLQVVTPQSVESLPYLSGDFLMQPAVDNTPSYRKGPAGDWLVPEKVDSKDGTIRLLLMTPERPRIIHIDVTIDGQPFRSICEQWIDSVLDTEKPPAKAAESKSTRGRLAESMDAPSDVAPGQFRSLSPVEWLREYVRGAPSPVDRYEARWLLAQRTGGPTLVELQRFSTNRSNAAPLIHFLDHDGDGQLSADEIAQAETRLAGGDLNQDGNVTLRELARARGKKGSPYQVWRAEPLVMVVDEHTDWDAFEKNLPVSAAGTKDLVSWKTKAVHSPDLTFKVRLGNDKSKVGVDLVDAGTVATADAIRTSTGAIAIGFAGGDVELSAGQSADEKNSAQVSVGAAIEGSPLWNLVDHDGNEQLSIRERNQIGKLLVGLDQNGDGSLAESEIPTRIRVGITLGSNVHNLLLQSAPPIPRAPRAPRAQAPDWFVSMDANRDGDLTIGEFVGTREQFQSLDANADGLISIQEAGKTP